MYCKRHTGFRKAHESLCADDGSEGDGTHIILLLSLTCCSILLLTESDRCHCL
jgi:hypothetical protein